MKNTRKTQNIRKSFYPAIFVLKLFGMWHIEGRLVILYKIYGQIMLALVGSLYSASMMMSVIEDWGDFQEVADAVYLLGSVIATTLKFALLDYKKMVATIEMLNCEQFNRHTEEQDVYIETVMKRTIRNSTIFQFMCTAVCWSWALGPLVTGTFKLKMLPLKGWYPFRTDSSPIYEITYLYQFLGIWFGALLVASLDTLVSGLMDHACGQLNVLKHSLIHLRHRAMLALYKQEICSCGDEIWRCHRSVHLTKNNADLEDEVYKDVIQCIRHHQTILEFVSEIESTFTASIFAQLCASVIAICITGIQLTILKPFSPEFISVSMYCSTVTIEIYLYCWYGNQVFLTSTTVKDAVYMSDWYRFGPRVNKLLLIMMERSQNPLRLTAGKLFHLSLDTFTSILRSAYSLFTVIQQMDMDIKI